MQVLVLIKSILELKPKALQGKIASSHVFGCKMGRDLMRDAGTRSQECVFPRLQAEPQVVKVFFEEVGSLIGNMMHSDHHHFSTIIIIK